MYLAKVSSLAWDTVCWEFDGHSGLLSGHALSQKVSLSHRDPLLFPGTGVEVGL